MILLHHSILSVYISKMSGPLREKGRTLCEALRYSFVLNQCLNKMHRTRKAIKQTEHIYRGTRLQKKKHLLIRLSRLNRLKGCISMIKQFIANLNIYHGQLTISRMEIIITSHYSTWSKHFCFSKSSTTSRKNWVLAIDVSSKKIWAKSEIDRMLFSPKISLSERQEATKEINWALQLI